MNQHQALEDELSDDERAALDNELAQADDDATAEAVDTHPDSEVVDEGNWSYWSTLWRHHERAILAWGTTHRVWWTPRRTADRHSTYDLAAAHLHYRALHRDEERAGGIAELYDTARRIGVIRVPRPSITGTVGVPLLATKLVMHDIATELDDYGDPMGADLVRTLIQRQWRGERPVAHDRRYQSDASRAGRDLARHISHYNLAPLPRGLAEVLKVGISQPATHGIAVHHLLRATMPSL